MNPKDRPKGEPVESIFSGPTSGPLWNSINGINTIGAEPVISKIATALYLLGCYCQKLEARVDKLERKVTDLQETRSSR